MKIEPRSRLALWTDVCEIWQYRDVLVMLASRDIKLRYRQTALGVLWVLLQPLLGGLISAIVFGRFIKLPSDGRPYLLFVLPGLVCWQLFSGIVQRGGMSLVTEARLISKVYFPRVIAPLAGAFSALVDAAVGIGLLMVVFFTYGLNPSWNLLWLPAVCLACVLFAIAVALGLAALNIHYRDVGYAMPFLLQIWLYGSPIIYSAEIVPPKWEFCYHLNSMAVISELFRWIWIGGNPPSLLTLAAGGVAGLVVFAASWLGFRRVEESLADRI